MTENCQSQVEGKWQAVSLLTGNTQLFIFTVKPIALLQESLLLSPLYQKAKLTTALSLQNKCGLREQYPHFYPAAQEQAAGNPFLAIPPSDQVILTHFSFRSIVRTGGGSAECSEVGDRVGGCGSRGASRAVRPKALGGLSTPLPILLAALPRGNKETSELPLPSILKQERGKLGLF